MIPEPQRTYLLELVTALGPAAKGLILVGGHALRFMVARPRPTLDFDFILDVAYLQGCDTLVRPVLASLGYKVADNARNFQFEKPIPNSREIMRIEFMAPEEFAKKGEIRVDVQKGIHGRTCVGGSIVVVETDEHKIAGNLPGGKLAEVTIHVTRPHTLVLLKLLALDDCYRNVRGPARAEHDREAAKDHARDIADVLKAQEADLGQFRTRFGGQFIEDPDLKNRTYKIIQDYFGGPTSPGIVLYGKSLRDSQHPDESVRNLESDLRQAQRLVSSLLLG